MKVISYMPIHYGREYLRESILSFIDLVDVLYIFYTSEGSMGQRSRRECPESQTELKTIAKKAAGDKLQWVDVSGKIGNEHQHRNLIFQYTNGYDLVFTSDADEVWDTDHLRKAMNQAAQSKGKNIGVEGYINLWRSFDFEVKDAFRPIRFYNLRAKANVMDVVQCRVWHFGYCQRERIMRYKFDVHGHKEIASDYVDRKYFAWTPDSKIKYLHPASNDVWVEAERYDKRQMPNLLKEHSNYNKHLV